MHAADEGRVDVVKLLLDRGAKIEAVDKVSISTVTTIAAQRLNLDTLYPLFCLYSGRIHGPDWQRR
jgi:ankyrin repeat protein